MQVFGLPGHIIRTGKLASQIAAKSQNNAAAIRRLRQEFPRQAPQRLPVRRQGIQVDGGSEFMAEFEQACKDKGLMLFVLPPKRPQLNGGVERQPAAPLTS